MARLYKKLLLLFILLLLTGCWDRVEIEERGFVIGAAIDITEESHDDSSWGTSARKRRDNYKLTYQYVVPAGMQSKGSTGSSSSGGSSEQKPYFNITEEGKTIFQISREMSNKISRSPYLQHFKLLVLSEDLSEKGYLYDALDIFVRDHEMRRAAKVMVAEGEALNALNIKTKNEKLPVMFLDSISENIRKTASIIPPTNIGDVHSYLLKKTSFVIPRLVINDQEAILSGAAVFDSQDQKMIGTLNGKETLGLNFITGEAESAVLEFYMKDQYFAVEVKEVKSKMTADVLADRKMKCTIQINAEGNIGETNGNLNVLNPKILAEVEKKTEEDIERLINQVIEKVQKEYKADVIGVGDTLREQHYRKWETVKENWDKGENYFSQSEIVVKVNFTIREIGASLETVQ